MSEPLQEPLKPDALSSTQTRDVPHAVPSHVRDELCGEDGRGAALQKPIREEEEEEGTETGGQPGLG